MPYPSHSRLGDPLENAIMFMRPFVNGIIERINVDEFNTVEFIEVLQTDPAARDAYASTVANWEEPEEAAKMVVHGQVIPTLLRESGMLEWMGYAHGVHDPYAVPAWWRKIGVGEDQSAGTASR